MPAASLPWLACLASRIQHGRVCVDMDTRHLSQMYRCRALSLRKQHYSPGHCRPTAHLPPRPRSWGRIRRLADDRRHVWAFRNCCTHALRAQKLSLRHWKQLTWFHVVLHSIIWKYPSSGDGSDALQPITPGSCGRTSPRARETLAQLGWWQRHYVALRRKAWRMQCAFVSPGANLSVRCSCALCVYRTVAARLQIRHLSISLPSL
jgi:hypothetical protein